MAYQNYNPFGTASNGADSSMYSLVNFQNDLYSQMGTTTQSDMDLFNDIFEFEPTHDLDFDSMIAAAVQGLEFPFGLPMQAGSTANAVAIVNPLKRPPHESDGASEITNGKSKRLRMEKRGYPCEHHSCTKVFDRAGDLRKHEKRTHMPETQRPHGCPHPGCGKRFHWMKDVKRHEGQMHSAHVAANGRPPLQITTGSHEDEDESDSKSTSSSKSRDGVEPGNHMRSGEPQTPLNTFSKAAAFGRMVMLLKTRIRRRKTSSAGTSRFVFVTTDESNFRSLNVSGVTDFDSAISSIRKALDISEGHEITIHRYNLARGNQESLDGDKLVSVMMEHADGLGTLKLHVTTMKKEGDADENAV